MKKVETKKTQQIRTKGQIWVDKKVDKDFGDKITEKFQKKILKKVKLRMEL